MNKIITFLLLIVLVVVGITYFSNKKTGEYSENTGTYPVGTSSSTSPFETGIATSTSMTSYTLAEVAMHKTSTDCWTTINGDVYDVTSWIGKHPGGERAILGLCGIDGSSAFNGQHGGQKRPASELAGFKIGTLK